MGVFLFGTADAASANVVVPCERDAAIRSGEHLIPAGERDSRNCGAVSTVAAC